MEPFEEISKFSQQIGAKRIDKSILKKKNIEDNNIIGNWMLEEFIKPHYFYYEQWILIIKISRTKPGFWGLMKRIVENLNIMITEFDGFCKYILVLLNKDCSGYIYSYKEINQNISDKIWKVAKDGNYKINENKLSAVNNSCYA